jgi:hypothetical protein
MQNTSGLCEQQQCMVASDILNLIDAKKNALITEYKGKCWVMKSCK